MRTFPPSLPSKARSLQYGVSIIEVMVALTLGLVAVGGAAAIYLANRRSFTIVENVGRLEENARFAIDLLSRDIREAGNSVCGGALIPTNIVTAPNDWALWDRALVGIVFANSPTPGLTIASPPGGSAQMSNTDSLLVWSGSAAGSPFQITSHSLASKSITTSGNTNYQANDVVVACDGSQLLTFEVASTPVANVLTYIDPSASSPQLNAGGYLTPLTAHVWYVGKSATTGGYALRRLTIDKTGSWGSNNDEMVTGVTGLQIRYLLADATGLPTGTDYQDSTAVGTQWPLVTAVRLTLTLSTLDPAGSTGSASTVITHDVPMTVNIKVRVP
jgi:type IV pilus assembly protein PilW